MKKRLTAICFGLVTVLTVTSVKLAFADQSAESQSISKVVDVQLKTSDSVIRLAVSNSDAITATKLGLTEHEDSVSYITDELNVSDITEYMDQAVAEIQEEKKVKDRGYSTTTFQGGLLDIEKVDDTYTSYPIQITGHDRDILERLVMGEAGGEGFVGAAILAQALRDTYVMGNFNSINAVRISYRYSGSIKLPPNKDVKDAVAYIFDNGNYAVKHRLVYMYQSKLMYSKFHESQDFILNYQGVKFFDRIG